MSKLLLLSNSTLPGTPFFTWPKPWVKKFLGEKPLRVAFVPFAAVTLSMDDYEKIVKAAFEEMGYELVSLHTATDKQSTLREADAIVVGGGNTFALLSRMYKENILTAVREKVLNGTPYVGWSAGANLACPTLMTTNDMPVVQPPSFESLNLVPFQINPHYHELKFEGQGGETRKERLQEFVSMNPKRKVVGLPEGMLLQRDGAKLTLQGEGVAKLYEFDKPVLELKSGSDLSHLL
jgi:dipeptidase E